MFCACRFQILGPQKIVKILYKKKGTFSFWSFSVAIGSILIFFVFLKSCWIILFGVFIFVCANAIVADCCAIVTDCWVYDQTDAKSDIRPKLQLFTRIFSRLLLIVLSVLEVLSCDFLKQNVLYYFSSVITLHDCSGM